MFDRPSLLARHTRQVPTNSVMVFFEPFPYKHKSEQDTHWGQAVPLPPLRQDLLHILQPQHSQEDPQWGEAAPVPDMSQEVTLTDFTNKNKETMQNSHSFHLIAEMKFNIPARH